MAARGEAAGRGWDVEFKHLDKLLRLLDPERPLAALPRDDRHILRRVPAQCEAW